MKRNRLEQLGDFVLGKGFYIALFLCVAAIGISGYYLIRSVSGSELGEPVTANPTLTVPDSSAENPAGEVLPEPEDSEPETPAVVPQRDDPQAEKETAGESAAPSAAPAEVRDVVYTWPVKGQVLRPFTVEALAYDATMGDWRTHGGLDIAAEAGRKVLSAGEGEVTEVYEDAMMGTTVVVHQPDGVVTSYSNLAQEVSVRPGDAVDTGTVLGTVGASALAESGMDSHLHVSMTLDGEPLDPLTRLPEQS